MAFKISLNFVNRHWAGILHDGGCQNWQYVRWRFLLMKCGKAHIRSRSILESKSEGCKMCSDDKRCIVHFEFRSVNGKSPRYFPGAIIEKKKQMVILPEPALPHTTVSSYTEEMYPRSNLYPAVMLNLLEAKRTFISSVHVIGVKIR